jgi:hypothetical protein
LRSRRGFLLLDALVSLAILGIVLVMGAGFFARRRDLERERLDREKAVRALASEWVFLRTSFTGELVPRKDVLFVGPGVFVDGLDARHPRLSIEGTEFPGLYFVHVEIGYGVRTPRRLVQEGYVFRGGGG